MIGVGIVKGPSQFWTTGSVTIPLVTRPGTIEASSRSSCLALLLPKTGKVERNGGDVSLFTARRTIGPTSPTPAAAVRPGEPGRAPERDPFIAGPFSGRPLGETGVTSDTRCSIVMAKEATANKMSSAAKYRRCL